MSSSDDRAGLIEVEARIVGYLAQLTHDHRELRDLDIEDPKQFRPYLDKWMDWHLDAAYWNVRAKQELAVANQALRSAKHNAIIGATEMQFKSKGIHFTGSYEERRVLWEMKTAQQQITFDLLERIVGAMQDFIHTLKYIHDYWDKRRIDTKWEAERRERTPGSDYGA